MYAFLQVPTQRIYALLLFYYKKGLGRHLVDCAQFFFAL
jgi:hypothetical protein